MRDSGCRGQGYLLNALALLPASNILNPNLLRALRVSVVIFQNEEVIIEAFLNRKRQGGADSGEDWI